MKKFRKKIRAVIPFIVVIAGIVLMLYPYISEYLFENRVDSEIMAYTDHVEKTENAQYESMLDQAEQYNRHLGTSQMQLTDPFTNTEENTDTPVYESLLRLDDSGIIGYVELPTIGVKLPIYQGTSAGDLERGVGHLKGSSLPVGGCGTHAVLTGHTGLSQAKLLSDLTEMKEGDVFFLSVLGRQLAYEVYATSVVLPEDTEQLRIEKDKDLVTLVTCTPYGINTHRLFVHGRRIAFSEQQYQEALSKTPAVGKSRWRSAYGNALLAGGALAVCLAVLLVFDIRKIIGVVLILLGGVTFMSPEIVQEYYQVKTRATLQMYNEQQNNHADKTEEMLYQRMLAYNQSIFEDKQTMISDPWDYADSPFGMENLTENVIGYVDVPALDQVFPVYFGATTEHMSEGVAVMSGTSMPIGGENTNCVLAGHRGYNQSKTFFKDIENLVEGDDIYITNQWERLRYRVTKIDIVDPDDFEAVRIQLGKDMLTLLTCHPYGSHGRYRYLVYCIRAEDDQRLEEHKSCEEKQIDYIAASDGRIYPSSKQDIQREKAFRLWCAAVILLVIMVPACGDRRRRHRAKGDEN